MIASAQYRFVPRPLAVDGAPLGRAVVLAIFAGWTLFSVFIYSRYSMLGDAQAYLEGGYGESSFTQGRTLLVASIAGGLRSVLGADVLVHLAFSMFAAAGVCHVASGAQLRGRQRWPLLLILLNPNFGVWASVTGRESLFVGLLGFFMGAVLGHYRRGRGVGAMLMAALSVAGMVYLRAPFGLGVALFFVVYLLFAWGPRLRLSVGVRALFFMLFAALTLYLAWPQVDAFIGDEVLPQARSYFTVTSATTRTWVDLRSTGDLLANVGWMAPLALVGPTPMEVLARPVMLPFFAAGLVVLGLLLRAVYTAFFMLREPPRAVVLLGWLPATAMMLVAYTPFGIYNPGSGIRYASCFLLFLIFPLLLPSTRFETAGQGGAGRIPLDEAAEDGR